MCLYTQQDPIGIAGGLNLYGYAGGDPINFSDPFGLMACEEEDEEAQAACLELEAAERLLSQGSDCPTCDMRAETAAQLARDNPEFAEAVTWGMAGTGAGIAVGGIIRVGAAGLSATASGASTAEIGLIGRTANALFGGSGVLNKGRYLRIGTSRDGGERVFRVAGRIVGWFKNDPHLVLWRMGPL
jgi:uncharacterized protein RhaS with RHS repeats